MTPTDQLTATAPFDVVAITSRLDTPLPDDYVLLPWHPRRHPRTGLTRRCAAVCTWLARIHEGDVQDVAGIVPSPVLAVILSKIAAASSPSPPAFSEASGPTPEGAPAPAPTNTPPAPTGDAGDTRPENLS